MPKLTDDELGELLRETFAGKEPLADHLPAAINRRSPVPALLAAAAVVAVLGAVLYGVNRAGQSDSVQPAASSPARSTPTLAKLPKDYYQRQQVEDSGDIWGIAIATIARKYEPADGWDAIQVNGAPGWPPGVTQSSGVTFTPADKSRIERAVNPLAPVIWGAPTSPASCAPGPVPIITVGRVVGKGDHQEVNVTLVLGCRNVHRATYQLRKVAGVWSITGQ